MDNQMNQTKTNDPRRIERAASPMADCGIARERLERLEGLGFSVALSHLQSGRRVARAGWNGKNQYIQLQVPDLGSKMSRPYLFIRTVDGELVPWVAAQTDLLAFDWCIVTEKTVLQYGEGGQTLAAEGR